MDPAVIGSANFGQIFKTALPGNFGGIGPEQVFSQPLVFTGNDGVQYIYLATTQNNIYKLDAKTGQILISRNMHVPFLTADLDGCVDINPTVGVTATGTIDPDTGIWYLTAKTYSDQFQGKIFGPSTKPGRLNGRYYFHGIDTQSPTLADVFQPVMIDGLTFRNNPNRMFIGGNQHQRPGLVIAGKYVYTGYASHCVQYNFTGAIIGFNKATGAVVEAFATQGGPEPNTVPGGGVWMSGGGISYDGSSLFFATGNGYASQLSGTSVPGRQPPSALEEAAVNAKINDDGTLNIIDFFMPWEKQQLDGADKDLGTTPLELLPTDTFTCANVKRMGVVTGKSGKTYVLNLDNLGGYQNGPNKLDAAIFVYQNENSVYAGAGVMPLGGGYIYINIIKYQTRIFKFSCDGSGNPQFTVVGSTKEFNANILGTGHGTTTSLNGQDGTGLLWVSDVEGLNLRIYNAIPQGGTLQLINSFNIVGVTKFTRPVFGNGRAYIGTTQGFFYGFGSPVNLPINCTAPVQFGSVSLGNSSQPKTITCTALTQTTVTGFAINGNPNFNVSYAPSVLATYQAGQTFTFQSYFVPKTVGPLSSDIIVNTTSAAAGFSINTPVTLYGTARSANPLIAIAPNTASFNVIAGQQAGGVNQSSIITNQGDSTLLLNNVRFSLKSETGPFLNGTNSTSGGGIQVGPFTFYGIPSSIPANSQTTVTINYNPTTTGNDAVYVSFGSNGGTSLLDVVAVAGSYPSALVQFEANDGSGRWITLDSTRHFSFGNVVEGNTKYLRFRVTNNGSASAVPLSITVSKPPYGVPGIVGANNNIDLAEGTLLKAGENATAVLYCSVPKSQVNVPSYAGSANWTMNTGDPVLGKLFMQFDCNAVAEQVGPLFSNGTAQYSYIGCYKDNTPSRQLATNIYTDTKNNTNAKCIAACSAAGWIFASTQYMQECWCGNAIPIYQSLERDCGYTCTGNGNQTCGGDGYTGDGPRMSLFADTTRYVNASSQPPLSIPQTYGPYNYVGCYSEKNGKALNAKQLVDTAGMTVEKCGAYCQGQGYPYFSLEYAYECYCGTSAGVNTAIATLTVDSGCGMTCRGNNSEYCGAGNYAQVYALNGTRLSSPTSSGTSPSSSATAVAKLSSYQYLGCYNETHDRRALADKGGGGNANTLDSCAAFCTGYNYFGVEFGSECYCGYSLYSNSIKQATDSGCQTKCAGNSTQNCGGPDFLNIYYANVTAVPTSPPVSSPSATVAPSVNLTNYKYMGCYNETHDRRALQDKQGGGNGNTLNTCAAFCQGYPWFGVEFGSECYCGYSLYSNSIKQSSESGCQTPCAGNKQQMCGGADFLNIYYTNVTVSATSTTAGPSVPTATGGPTVVPVAGGYSFLDCYNEVPGRALTASSVANSSVTVELCASFCAKYSYFSVEYGQECYCGNSIVSGSNGGSTACTMPCAGNPNELCGGSGAMNMYMRNGTLPTSSAGPSPTSNVTMSVSSTSTSPTPTVTNPVQSVGAFMLQGCYNEIDGRALSAASYSNSSNTVEQCAAFCASYTYFGVEYGAECYCDNSLGTGSVSGNSNCNMACAGNQGEFCGGPGALNVYRKNVTTPTGSSAAPSATTAPSTVGQYTSLGCYTDNVGGRAFPSIYTDPKNKMTLDMCAAQAFANNAQYFGVEYGSECWYSGPAPAVIAGNNNVTTQNKCGMKCPGNGNQWCGGGNALQMYRRLAVSAVSSTSSSSSSSSVVSTSSSSSVAASSSSSSSTVSSSSSAVTSSSSSSTKGSASSSTSSVVSSSSTSSVASSSTSSSTSSSSSVATSSSSSTKGSASTSTSSVVSSSSPVSSSSSSSSAVTSSSSSSTKGSASSSTSLVVSSSSTSSVASSSTSSSTSSSSSVATSSSSSTKGSASTSTLSSSSSSSTKGSATSSTSSSSAGSASTTTKSSSSTVASSSSSTTSTTTGLAAVLTTSSSSSAVVSPTPSSSSSSSAAVSPSPSPSSSSTSSSSSSSSSSSTSSGPTAVATVSGYVYKGCYNESATGRTFGDDSTVLAGTMTVQACAAYCKSYAWFGVEYSNQCYCGRYPRTDTGIQAPTDCAMTCDGDATQLCGGPNRLNAYYSSDSSKLSSDPTEAATTGNYVYYNCVADNPRVLTYSKANSSMTIQVCAALADQQKYKYFGLEYSSECWMGNTLNNALKNSTGCTMTCSGNKSQFCGGSSRLSFYTRKAGV